MAIRKYAKFEGAQVLDLKGSSTRVREASLSKLADFEDYRTEDGFLYARIRAISSRVNKNHDGWPSIELAGGQDIFDRHHSSEGGFVVEADNSREYGYSTFLGKPIFVDHNNHDPSRARGVIVDAKLHVDDHKTSSLDPYYASPDVDPEHTPATWVELLLEVDAKSFPKLAKAIIEGSRNPKKGIDGFSMGCDVEKSVCSICKNAASAPEDYCNHVRMKGAQFDYHDPKTGHRTSRKAYENCYGVRFFEISAVFDPADETALLREVRSSVNREAGMPSDSFPVKGTPWCSYCGGTGHDYKAARGPDGQPPICPQCKGSSLEPQPDLGFLPETDHPLGREGKQAGMPLPCPDCFGRGIQSPELSGNGTISCPTCKGSGTQANEHGQLTLPGLPKGNDGIQTPGRLGPEDMNVEPVELDPKLRNNYMYSKTADNNNPLPQADMPHAPQDINTLRQENICPVCGSSMDEETCDICGYEQEPEGFDNPDLTKAQDTDLQMEQAEENGNPEITVPREDQAKVVNEPRNPTALAHVSTDWDVPVPKTAGRINPSEKPLVNTTGPATDEPREKIIKDQTKPITSHVRTASDFIAAAGSRRTDMKHTADSASGVAKPDTKTDVTGVGGVMDASNESASTAEAQIDVTGIGGTGVEGVSADKSTQVEQGDEHSKNIEGTPTDTWSGMERQHDPVTSEPFPAHEDGVKAARWVVEGHDDAAYPGDEIAGGTAVEGTQPADPVGKAQDRVNVLDHVTSPSNNSGPTTTWSGTDGNGVTKQVDPVTGESIARGEINGENGANWGKSSHVFAAFKLADLEVELGLIPAEKKYERAAELENEAPSIVEASLRYAQRMRTASARKTAGVQKLPVMGRGSKVESTVKEAAVEQADDSFMFGGL